MFQRHVQQTQKWSYRNKQYFLARFSIREMSLIEDDSGKL